MNYYTSDNHFGHQNIIKHCNRPFASVEEMDACMIERWNKVVGKHDTIYVLGDFCFRGKPASHYLQQLNGRKILILGNHDDKKCLKAREWTSVHNYLEVMEDGEKVVLSHYGFRVWNGSHHASYHLYGHSHGALPGFRHSAQGGGCHDVGVDVWDFRPQSWITLKDAIANTPIRAR